MSLAIFIYFYVLVKRYASPHRTFVRQVKLDPAACLSKRQRASLQGIENPICMEDIHELRKATGGVETGTMSDIKRGQTEEKLHEVNQTFISSQHEGVNFYLRLGAVGEYVWCSLKHVYGYFAGSLQSYMIPLML